MTAYDQTYKEQFDLLTFHTNEYVQSISFIETTLIPKLPEKRHFLDIGAGRGTISMPMSGHFEQTTIVEPNTVYFQEVLDWAQGANVNLDGHNGDWLEIDSSQIKANFVVLSHVLYFVPYANHLRFVQKLMKAFYRADIWWLFLFRQRVASRIFIGLYYRHKIIKKCLLSKLCLSIYGLRVMTIYI